MTPDTNGRSPWDRLPALHLRVVLLELEAHPERIDEGRLAGFLRVPRAELRVAREEAWRSLPADRDALARRAREDGLMMPLDGEGTFPAPDEEEIRATVRRVIAARPRPPSPPLFDARRRRTRRSRRSPSRWGYGT